MSAKARVNCLGKSSRSTPSSGGAVAISLVVTGPNILEQLPKPGFHTLRKAVHPDAHVRNAGGFGAATRDGPGRLVVRAREQCRARILGLMLVLDGQADAVAPGVLPENFLDRAINIDRRACAELGCKHGRHVVSQFRDALIGLELDDLGPD